MAGFMDELMSGKAGLYGQWSVISGVDRADTWLEETRDGWNWGLFGTLDGLGEL